jgi:hypothetical protein
MRRPGRFSLALAFLTPLFLAGSFAPARAVLPPFVTNISTRPDPACAEQVTTLVLDGLFTDGCGQVLGTEQFGADRVIVNLRPYAAGDTACPQVLTPWRREFNLGQLPAGSRTVEVVIRIFGPNANEPPNIFVEPFTFQVQPTCQGGGGLPFVKSIGVTAAPPCNPATVVGPCRGESLGVCILGNFPNGCYRLLRVELLPSPIVGPMPQPPIVRVVVDDQACILQDCAPESVQFVATATLPPLPPGPYGLMVQMAIVTCDGPIDSTRLHQTTVPFSVLECGPPPGGCLVGDLIPNGRGLCSAIVAPGRPADVPFSVQTSVTLAGLEGQFDLDPPGLRIVGIETLDATSGFQLQWAPTPSGGAHFVLFGDDPGEVIPGGQPPIRSEVLKVRFAVPEGVTAPNHTMVLVNSLLGSDPNGGAVTLCAVPARDPMLPFIICADAPCDFNHDGMLDVRDLVLMVNCLHGPCMRPPGTGDCNGDSLFTIDDVLCCATQLLRESCPDCPTDSTARPEPSVAVRFGEPKFVAGGVDVPVRIEGSQLVGGARLAIRYPSDRYDARTEMAPGMNGWLHLEEARANQLVVGLVQMGPAAANGPQVVDFVLHLTERAGQSVGGAVALQDVDVSDRTGVTLLIDSSRPTVDLGRAPNLSLGESRPNPTTGVTRFSLTLDRPGQVDIAIYDVSGRRIATVLSGHQEAGTRDLMWDGRTSDGREVPQGLYFYRGVTAGQVVSRKLVLVRGR